MMKVMVTGDRHYRDRDTVVYVLSQLPRDTIVIQGECEGADLLCKEVAISLGMTTEDYPADWDKHGRAAGPIRNRQMLDRQPDMVLAFHRDLSKSKGTRDAVSEAVRRGIPVGYYGGCSADQLRL